MTILDNFLRWLRRILHMDYVRVLPPVSEPPWTISGGAESEMVIPGWKHLEDGIIKAYYGIHCQIWPVDWWPGPTIGIEPGTIFDIITEVELLFEPATPKTIDVYIQGIDVCPDHKPVPVHEGINIIHTKCNMAGYIGSYVLTAASLDATKNSQIHFKINKVEFRY